MQRVGRNALEHAADFVVLKYGDLCVLHLFYNRTESRGIVQSEIGKHLAVDFNTALVDKTHQLGIAEILGAGCCVDTLNPKSAEVTLFVLAVAVSIGKTFFPSILGNGPHIAAASEITTCEFKDFLATCS